MPGELGGVTADELDTETDVEDLSDKEYVLQFSRISTRFAEMELEAQSEQASVSRVAYLKRALFGPDDVLESVEERNEELTVLAERMEDLIKNISDRFPEENDETRGFY